MDNNTRNEEKSFDRVELRIELLEQEIQKKDEKLKKLLNASKDKDAKIAELQKGAAKVTMSDDAFVPVFQGKDDAQDEDYAEETYDRPEAFKRQLEIINKREQMVKEMLDTLEEAFTVLKERNDALNKKEETLNREYLKLLEIESLYKGTDKLADSLGSVLPSFGLEEKKPEVQLTENNIEE
ncbi:MAG: hypothetical protein RR614_02665 [Eubacterium sp.]